MCQKVSSKKQTNLNKSSILKILEMMTSILFHTLMMLTILSHLQMIYMKPNRIINPRKERLR